VSGIISTRQGMPATERTPFMVVLNLLLCIFLIGAVDISLGEQTEGIPYFNDAGELSLPLESVAELQESMPELQLFPLLSAPKFLPELGSASDSFDLGD